MDYIGESSVRLPKTVQRINTALRHNTDAGSKKTAVFFWLDQGLPLMSTINTEGVLATDENALNTTCLTDGPLDL